MDIFDPKELNKLFRPKEKSVGEDNGQVTIIGGSKLFHGAPILALKTASRIVDMVFFSSPDPSIGNIAERVKSRLMSFIWVPWQEVEAYVAKSNSVLIGPGLMRYKSDKRQVTSNRLSKNSVKNNLLHNSKLDEVGKLTHDITKRLLTKFPTKRWVVDAGSLQVIRPETLPKGCIITPNKKEYQILFGDLPVEEAAKKFNLTLVLKGPETIVCSQGVSTKITNGNPGMTKGGTGDVLAGLTVSLFAKNEAHLSACAASYVEKFAGDALFKEKGVYYNADDLADKIPEVLRALTG